MKLENIIQNKNAAKEEQDNTPTEATPKKRHHILAELNKNLVMNFSEIAFDNNNETKAKLNLIFDKIRDTNPRNPEEAYIIDAPKILIASNNGFVFMFDDEMSSTNLNLISDNEEFILYIKHYMIKFNSQMVIIILFPLILFLINLQLK